MQIMWIKLLILCFLLSAAECGSHSLEFLSTGRVQPGDRPQFEQLTVFDGVPISYCDILTKREEFKPSLESKNLPESCDEAIYQVLQPAHEIPKLLNNTVYVVQRRRGCIQSANGDVSGFEAWAVNGMDFMSFDPESKTWTSHSTSAERVEDRWNKNTPRNSDFQRFIIEKCAEMIGRIKLRSSHRKTELYVFAKPTVNTDQALLRCHVTTTDKSVTSVHLIGNGASKASWITVTGPVPSEDGSVILRLTAGISLRENTNTYGCAIQTGGHNFTVYWDGNSRDGRYLLDYYDWRSLKLIIGVCCVVFTPIIISCGMIILLRVVKMKSRHPSRVDPQLQVQFTRIGQTVTSPDLHNVILSCTQGTDRSTDYDKWVVKIMLADQTFYDPEFFAHKTDVENVDKLISTV